MASNYTAILLWQANLRIRAEHDSAAGFQLEPEPMPLEHVLAHAGEAMKSPYVPKIVGPL